MLHNVCIHFRVLEEDDLEEENDDDDAMADAHFPDNNLGSNIEIARRIRDSIKNALLNEQK